MSVLPKAILSQHVAILGKTRSGKSSVMRLLVEGLLAEQKPVCIVDPKGDWWGIKLAADGKSSGYPVVIFGGEHADVPINEHSGAQVAELFATGNRPCLIDLGGWMVAPRTRFWIDFASNLFKHTKGQRWLAVDEVHNFCPKGTLKGQEGEPAKMLHWTNRIASEGLGKGVAMIFASQRPQKVHNDTLTSAETLIAMRVLHPSDRGAVAAWIAGCGDSEGSEVLNSLANMARGEGWVWSPEIHFGPERVTFPMFQTYDSFRPQTIEETKKLKGWAEVDLDEVRAKLAAVIEKEKSNDPKELRRRIAELERELAKKPAAAPTVERVEVPVLTEKDHELFRSVRTAFEGFEKTARSLIEDGPARDLYRSVNSLEGALLARLNAVQSRPQRATAPPSPLRGAQAGLSPQPAGGAAGGGSGEPLTGPERKILTALVQHGRCSVGRLALLTRYAKSGGAFRNPLSALRVRGLIDGRGEIEATAAGVAAVGEIDPLPTGPELVGWWLSELGGPERKILSAVVGAGADGISIPDLAAATEYEASGGAFRNPISRLRTLGLIEGRGELRAAEELLG